jgi:hypothetical protein
VELCLSIRKGGVELSFVFGKVFNIIVSSLLLYHASVSVTTHFTIVVLLVALV